VSFVAGVYARVAALGENAGRSGSAVERRSTLIGGEALIVQQELSRQGTSSVGLGSELAASQATGDSAGKRPPSYRGRILGAIPPPRKLD
jgi:hypothetical protein